MWETGTATGFLPFAWMTSLVSKGRQIAQWRFTVSLLVIPLMVPLDSQPTLTWYEERDRFVSRLDEFCCFASMTIASSDPITKISPGRLVIGCVGVRT
jgi:hypothetical protein